MILWIIGAGGLLGSALRRVASDQSCLVVTSEQVPWSDAEATVEAIRADAVEFRAMVEATPGRTWGIVWTAGRATTASSSEETAEELRVFESCLQAITETLGGLTGGVFALASSAGGVYAGSSPPPFSSSSEPRPLGAYGQLKLDQENAAVRSMGSSTGVVIARIANLYGPGQDLSKLQGLISRLALTSVTKQPLSMFVPLDTLRDYITADDAAARLLHWISKSNGSVETRVIASGQATSLGYLINLMKDITRVATPIASGVHASAAYQSGDLRLVPDTDDAIGVMPLTPLPAGLKLVYQDILSRTQRGTHSARFR